VNRPEAVAVVALAILLAWGSMYLGWKRRAARQSDVPPLPAVPAGLADRASSEGIEGTYVSTTSAEDPLDRITASGLGMGGVARVLVVDTGEQPGVVVARSGAATVFVPAAALIDVRVESMRAGKAAPHGLVTIEWHLGSRTVATAFRPRDPQDRETVLRSVRALIAAQAAA
jgi:hypothetical protein